MKIEDKIGKILIETGLKVSTAESCTGGLLSSKLTEVSGSSAYTYLNLVTYSNAMKTKMLGVPEEIFEKYGAVSEECAFEMAKGLHAMTGADICISTTGIAGPTGGTRKKPVGLMYCCIYTPNRFKIYRTKANSRLGRRKIKDTLATMALNFLYEFLTE